MRANHTLQSHERIIIIQSPERIIIQSPERNYLLSTTMSTHSHSDAILYGLLDGYSDLYFDGPNGDPVDIFHRLYIHPRVDTRTIAEGLFPLINEEGMYKIVRMLYFRMDFNFLKEALDYPEAKEKILAATSRFLQTPFFVVDFIDGVDWYIHHIVDRLDSYPELFDKINKGAADRPTGGYIEYSVNPLEESVKILNKIYKGLTEIGSVWLVEAIKKSQDNRAACTCEGCADIIKI